MQIDTTTQQIKDLLQSEATQKVLITSGTNVDADAVGSALALAEALQSQWNKQVTVAIDGFETASYAFLPGVEQIKSQVGQKSLVVSIDVGENPIEKINYNADGTKFNLTLTPKMGQVDVDQIEYSYTGLNYDVIVVVDTAKKLLLGGWADSFSTEMADIPLVNIDHHPDNEQFGTLNLINSDQASAAGMVHELVGALGLTMTARVATNLLAGLLSDTGGFMNSNSDAASIRLAADLVEAGADLRRVMNGLFKAMSVTAMHLWSRVLERVELIDPGIVVTEVTQEDLVTTGASGADKDTLDRLVNGMMTGVPGARVALVIKEKEDGEVRGSLRAIDLSVDVQQMAHQLGGGGHVAAAGFQLTDTTLKQAREQALAVVQQALSASPVASENTSEEEPDSEEISQ